MSYKVGQPVWVISYVGGTWHKGTIAGPLERMNYEEYGIPKCGDVHMTDVPTASNYDAADPLFPIPLAYLRPRDPDQHLPAVDFDWLNIKAPETTE